MEPKIVPFIVCGLRNIQHACPESDALISNGGSDPAADPS